MKQYLDLLRDVRANGIIKTDRTGTGTQSVFGRQMRFDLQQGFPLVTTKKLHLKSIVHELLWFLAGDTNIKYLKDNGVTIWDEWADANGDLGPVYGEQWRSWRGAGEPYTDSDALNSTKTVDQISWVRDRLMTHPDCRRLIVSAWNVPEIPNMALAPCHVMFQFYTREMTIEQRLEYAKKHEGVSYVRTTDRLDRVTHALDALEVPRRFLDCQLYQRSCDLFLGVPFNVASYAMLVHMMAQQTNMLPGEFVWTGGDCHIYSNHTEQVDLQLTREPRALPQLQLRKAPSLFDYKFEDFEIEGYDPHPAIKGQVAV